MYTIFFEIWNMPKFGYVILKYILSLILKYFMFFFRKEQAEKKGKKLNHNDGAGGDEFLTVNLEKMLLMLNNVFTLPRSYRSMEGLRTAASDYISQKLGNLGLIVGIQYFFPSRFYHQVIFKHSGLKNIHEKCKFLEEQSMY